MAIASVSRSDVAQLSNSIVSGEFGGVPSIANARHVRRALSGLFTWAAEAGRDHVEVNPCRDLPPLPVEYPRSRVLNADEIRTLWLGLDRVDTVGRRTKLALRFALACMLRSAEFLPLRRDEIIDLDGSNPYLAIPARRVKKRRPILQPLSPLAVSIVREALTDDGQEFVFQTTPQARKPPHRYCMAVALRGRRDKGTQGICEMLGIESFVPHDLRRSCASIAGNLGFSDSAIARCLDHQQAEKGVSSITTRVYIHSPRMQEKRAVLDGVAGELRRIIDPRDNVVQMGARR